MKVALVGATGFIGSKILAEAVDRGHVVTALCRHPENVLKHQNVQAVFADVMDTPTLERLLFGHAAIIHSYSPPYNKEIRAHVNDYVARLTSTGLSQMEALALYRPPDAAAHQADVHARIEAQTTATRSII